MKKKLLGQIPLEPIQLSKQWKKNWIASVKKIEIDEESTLLINLYENIQDIKSVSPKYRVFISKTDDITQDIENNTWNKKKIEYVMSNWRPINDSCQFADKESEKYIDEFLDNKKSWHKGLEKVNEHQYDLRREKANRAYYLRCKAIKDEMKEVDSLAIPIDFRKFIDDNAFLDNRYAFYTSNSSRRYFEVSCSHCEQEYTIDAKENDKPKHNEAGVCKHCKSKIIFKSHGKVKNIHEYKDVILMLKYKEGFVSKYYEVLKSSYKGNEKYEIREKARVIYTGTTTKVYYGSKDSRYYHDDPNWWDSNGNQVKFGSGVLYYNNIKEVLCDTVFKYSALDLLARHKESYISNHNGFLSKFEKNQYLEYFIKMGLYSLTNDLVSRYSMSNAINAAGKNVIDILQLSKQQVNRLIDLDGNLYMLQLLQLEEREGKKFTDEQLNFLSVNDINLDTLERVLKFTTLGKAIKYLSIKRSYSSVKNILNDWLDYLENCRLLNYNVEDEFVLFPRHFKQAHDNVVDIILKKKNEANAELFTERMNLARLDYEYQSKKYAMILPNTADEIIKEGQTLHHCVGTYVNRVLEGRSIILFLRLLEDITTPFYTMEISNGQIIQVRGKNNCSTTAEINRFVESFKRNKLGIMLEREAV